MHDCHGLCWLVHKAGNCIEYWLYICSYEHPYKSWVLLYLLSLSTRVCRVKYELSLLMHKKVQHFWRLQVLFAHQKKFISLSVLSKAHSTTKDICKLCCFLFKLCSTSGIAKRLFQKELTLLACILIYHVNCCEIGHTYVANTRHFSQAGQIDETSSTTERLYSPTLVLHSIWE